MKLFEILDKLREKMLELFPQKSVRHIYHYTTSEVLWEFLKPNNDFLCTYCKALSDPTEFRTGAFAVTRICQELNIEVDKILRYMNLLAGASGKNWWPWVMSFSIDRDDTGQWRTYTSKSLGGYSIGFNVDRITRALRLFDNRTHDYWALISLLPCVYVGYDDQSNIKELVRYALINLKPELKGLLDRNIRREDSAEIADALLYFLLSSVVKHKDFREEREWRLIVQPIELANVAEKCRMAGEKIRISSGLCEGSMKMSDFIDEIIVSPHGQTENLRAKAEMYAALRKLDNRDGKLIVASESPYRGEAL